MDSLLSARNLIAQSLEQSNSMSSAMEASSCRLRKMNSNLEGSTKRLRSLHQRIATLSTLSLHADHAAGPASAHSSVVLLGRSLSATNPAADLSGYLASVRRLEQALSFLTENCTLAIHWLNDVATSLLDEADEGYALNVKRALGVLEQLKAMEVEARLPGGVISLAMDKLELQLRRIILEMEISEFSLEKLDATVDRLRCNGRGERVGPIYLEVRVSKVKPRFVLPPEVYRSDDGSLIAKWAKDLEVEVKQVVQFEYDFCRRICEGLGGTVISMDYYAEIIVESGFLDLLGFGHKVLAAKKDAIKLLKLLEVFAVLDGLRLDFNRLFGGKECVRVQQVTRDLVRRVVEETYVIFNQLALEVEQQPPPPLDGGGGVPRLVCFVTEYCVVLMEEKYMPTLLKVLSIHRIWNRQRQVDESGDQEMIVLVREEVCRVLGALETNLDKWSNKLDDPTHACFFLLKNYHFLHSSLRDTKLGDLLGGEWLGGYYAKMEYYAAAYLQHSCGKLSSVAERLTLGRRMKAYT